MNANGESAGILYQPGSGAGEGLMLDLYRAADSAVAPVVVYAHGGSFVRGDRADHRDARLRALARHGVTVASIDYRLAPRHRYPDAIHDVRAAVRFLRRNADGLGLPTDKIGAVGASAGGYLVTMAALGPLGHDERIDAVSPWFAPTDLYRSSRRSPLESSLFPVSFVHNLLGSLDPALLREASPVNAELAEAPPFLFVQGDCDQLIAPWQSAALHDALVSAGRSSTVVLAGGAGHEDPLIDAGPILPLAAAWFRSTLAT